jgi:hypothetical protein
MAVRRRLVDEVKPDPALEKSFVFSGKPLPPEAAPPITEPLTAPEVKDAVTPEDKETMLPEAKAQGSTVIARAPLTTRVRADFGAALKRASLERQLNGVFPQTVQDILEAALEPWLRNNGYLP